MQTTPTQEQTVYTRPEYKMDRAMIVALRRAQSQPPIPSMVSKKEITK